MGHLEAYELVEEGNLVPEELQELVGIADVLSSRHVRRDLDALVEGIQSFLSMRPPEFGQAALDWVVSIFIAITEPRLKVRDAKDALQGCIDPARAILITESEHHG
jgi:hypothetical protein